jgi:hypothetical protein
MMRIHPMQKNPAIPTVLSHEQIQDAFESKAGLPSRSDPLGTRLQMLADLIGKADPLPRVPLLLWEESDKSVRHVAVGNVLFVGRQPGENGLALAEDKLLSRHHFAVRKIGEDYMVEDLKSRNHTALNLRQNRIQNCLLRDGDLIFAGSHIFVFLYQRHGDLV